MHPLTGGLVRAPSRKQSCACTLSRTNFQCVPVTPSTSLQVCGLQPGEFVHTAGDAHVYSNHVEPLKQQLANAPRHLPRLLLNPQKKAIDEFTADDFTLLDYTPHKTIKMQMAV
eukprot:GHRQ01030366.1.p3 GENE.GHRQ01030366.1~~GHRQ01030366.1.p3  ORF type:complete len:114 (-),score=52.96 GHRQ01030366.1:135-476(-)